eukprot:TRINITY_DN275_c0_g4_i1.p1 TRINITY_DN275_c0_g4~~TRINITY_DN275_c0_g4_i1.p1  ORF type:complete len:222 (+),score=31.33 TRINITY_DN275_c0_g4_i1:175-840(+)
MARKRRRGRAGHRLRTSEAVEVAPPVVEEPIDNSNVLAVPAVRSVAGHPPSTIVTFVNNTNVLIQTWWIDWNSQEVPYADIMPGEKYSQQTYHGHPWVFSVADTGELLVVDRKVVFLPEEIPESVAIVSRPDILVWNRDVHHRFPPCYKSFVLSLLLSHNRARKAHNFCLPTPSLGQGRRRPARKRREPSLGQLLTSLPADIIVDIISFIAPTTVLDILPS